MRVAPLGQAPVQDPTRAGAGRSRPGTARRAPCRRRRTRSGDGGTARIPRARRTMAVTSNSPPAACTGKWPYTRRRLAPRPGRSVRIRALAAPKSSASPAPRSCASSAASPSSAILTDRLGQPQGFELAQELGDLLAHRLSPFSAAEVLNEVRLRPRCRRHRVKHRAATPFRRWVSQVSGLKTSAS